MTKKGRFEKERDEEEDTVFKNKVHLFAINKLKVLRKEIDKLQKISLRRKNPNESYILREQYLWKAPMFKFIRVYMNVSLMFFVPLESFALIWKRHSFKREHTLSCVEFICSFFKFIIMNFGRKEMLHRIQSSKKRVYMQGK